MSNFGNLDSEWLASLEPVGGKTAEEVVETTSAPAYTNEPEYKAAVVEGLAIVADIASKQWRLGDLADKVVEKNYGENALERFAEDINFDGLYTTLDGYRRVCRAFPKNLGRPRFFAAAQVLAPHPDRAEIVKGNPAISEREARDLTRAYRDKQEQNNDDKNKPGGDPAKSKPKGGKKKRKQDDQQAHINESKRLLSKQLEQANQMIGAAEARKKTAPDQRRYMGIAAATAPATLKTMREAGEAWLDYIDWLEEAAAEAKEAAADRANKSPKPAEPAQAVT
jgi:hypothetical protein